MKAKHTAEQGPNWPQELLSQLQTTNNGVVEVTGGRAEEKAPVIKGLAGQLQQAGVPVVVYGREQLKELEDPQLSNSQRATALTNDVEKRLRRQRRWLAEQRGSANLPPESMEVVFVDNPPGGFNKELANLTQQRGKEVPGRVYVVSTPYRTV